MQRIKALTILTFKEGMRDRALHGITVMALLMLMTVILLTNLFGHELGKVMVDLCLSTIALAGLLLTFFININLMAKDIDKRTIYSVLSKPISRTEYVIGKYLGLILLVFVALSLLCLFSVAIILMTKNTAPAKYFQDFSWVCYFQAFSYEMMMFFLLNAIVIFFSSITTSSFLTLIFSLCVYIAGQSIEEVVIFFKKEALLYKASSPINEVAIQFIQYIFPNLSAFDIKIFSSHGKLMSLENTLTIFGYSIIYSILLLFFASLIFNRRELK
ncbi:ABC transporter permease [Desulfobacula toluolica]|uniref:Putative ABC transporter, permease protein n=1 Tax=Desulfobacula toluolica (strain DSM 7467 / Tol2) TaxID=651182 RepID=K0N8Q3_DESTT|nr:ABC transporter permease subunit [Desulfobacula toluolica]CCK80294.1 putative ABC transporter, permease protein [Desulfobacula toluolica Tol2]